jgi:hypothetical protein
MAQYLRDRLAVRRPCCNLVFQIGETLLDFLVSLIQALVDLLDGFTNSAKAVIDLLMRSLQLLLELGFKKLL